MTGSSFELTFDNRYLSALPADPNPQNRRRQVFGAAYSRVKPTPVAAPKTMAYAQEVAALLGMDPAVCQTQGFADVFAGNRLLDGMDPYANCYGGHQFGNWARQLGDGRAISLGEVEGPGGGWGLLQFQIKKKISNLEKVTK